MFPLTQPLHTQWTGPEHTPHPHTLPPTPREQALGEVEAEGEGEGDSGFQEAGVCPRPKLGSPERASESLMLAPSHQLVPMVGPQHGPVDVQLSSSYMDKARQASEYLLGQRWRRGRIRVGGGFKEAVKMLSHVLLPWQQSWVLEGLLELWNPWLWRPLSAVLTHRPLFLSGDWMRLSRAGQIFPPPSVFQEFSSLSLFIGIKASD